MTTQANFPKGLIPIIAIVFLAIIFLSKSTVTIRAGEAGVLYKTIDGGVVTDKPALEAPMPPMGGAPGMGGMPGMM